MTRDITQRARRDTRTDWRARAYPSGCPRDGYDDREVVVGPWGYDPVRRVPLCDHWRVPVEVTEDVVFYASAYCDRLRSNQGSTEHV